MKKVKFLLMLFLLSSTFSYAQKTRQRIHLRIMALTEDQGAFEIPPELSIDIKRQGKNIKIIFSKTDSLNQLAMLSDPGLIEGLKPGTRPDDWLECMFTYVRKHSALLHMDSLSIRDRGTYSKLVDLVWKQDLGASPASFSDILVIEESENEPMEYTDESELILQLYRFSGSKLKDRRYVSSPLKEPYPDIYNLLAASLELYRKDHPNSFLDKKNVSY